MDIKRDHIIVKLPADQWPSIVVGVSGQSCKVEIADDGSRVVQMTPDDARALIGTPLSANLKWREANPALLARLGPPERPSPGISLPRLQRSVADAAPRDPQDRFGSAREILRRMGRLR
jgi:hypothetical protein